MEFWLEYQRFCVITEPLFIYTHVKLLNYVYYLCVDNCNSNSLFQPSDPVRS